MNHPKIHFSFCILFLLVFLSACAGSKAEPTIPLESCILGDKAALCGTLPVYENRAAHNGRVINLHIAVVKAQSEDPAPDPIFWLAGGPGVSAIEDTPYAMQVLGLANEQRDVVFVDQRGTGGSKKLVCPRSTDPARQYDSISLQGDCNAVVLGYDACRIVRGWHGFVYSLIFLSFKLRLNYSKVFANFL